MKRWRQSAALRISLAWSAGYALGMVVLGIIVFFAMHYAFTRQMDGVIAQDAQSLAGRYHEDGLGELEDAIAERTASQVSTRPMYALFDRGGKRVAGDLVTRVPKTGFSDIVFQDPVEGADWARAYTIDISPALRLVVAEDREWIEQIDGTIIAVFAAGFLGLIAFGAAATIVFASYLRRRLEGFRSGAEQVISGRIEDRMPVSSRGDEFDELAITLNSMLDRIEGLVTNLRQVSNDIAHDLRTPLTRLRQKLESSTAKAAGTNFEASLADALESTDAVLSLFGSILHLSEVERGGRLPVSDLDLSALARELAESYEPAVAAAGRSLKWDLTEGVTIHANRSLIAQALSNLIDNAQAHTPVGSKITLSLRVADKHAMLMVEDDGPGIPLPDRERAIRRFERLDSARAATGFGLGLALVSAVAQRFDGRLELDDAKPGLSATIWLPLA